MKDISSNKEDRCETIMILNPIQTWVIVPKVKAI